MSPISLIAILCVVVSTVTAVPPFQDLAVLTCGGNGRPAEAHIFPSHPILGLGVNANQFRKFWNGVVADIVSDASCLCPTMPAARAQQAFGITMTNLLRAIDGSADTDYTAYASCGFSQTMEYLKTKLAITLPAGCTAANFESGQACLVKWTPTTFFSGSTFQIAVQKCPSTSDPNDAFNLPYISISCAGGVCSDLAQPCDTNNDCVESTCDAYQPEVLSGTAGQSVFSKLLNSVWADSTSPIPEWSVSGTGSVRDSALGNKFLTETLKYINTAAGRPAVANGLKFCGINQLTGYLQWIPICYLGYCYFPAFGQGPYGYGQYDINSLLFPIWPYVDKIFGPIGGIPFLWWHQFFNAVEFPVDGQGRQTWPNIASWDGTLAGGGSAVDSGRVLGSSLPVLGASSVSPTGDPERIGVAFIDCNGGITITPDSPTTITAKIPAISSFWNALFQVEKTVINSRTNPDLTAAQANVRFNPASLEFWLEMATVHGLFDRGDATANDLQTKLGSSVFGYPSRVDKLNVPTTCSLETYLATGTCTFQFNGQPTNTPFPGLEQGFQVQFTQCPNNPNGPPRVDIMCVGQACHGIYEPYQTNICKQAGDCAAGVCTYWSFPAFTSAYFWGGVQDITCSNAAKSSMSALTSLRNAFMNVHNPPTTTTVVQSVGFCKTALQTFTLANFVNGVGYTEDSSFRITVNGLVSTNPFSTTSASSSLVSSWVFALVLMALCVLLSC